jgi:hypothetical protein
MAYNINILFFVEKKKRKRKRKKEKNQNFCIKVAILFPFKKTNEKLLRIRSPSKKKEKMGGTNC